MDRYNNYVDNSWAQLENALHLYSSGYHNAAKSVWMKLPDAFQQNVRRFVLDIASSPDDVIDSCPDVTMESPHGNIALSPRFLRSLKDVAPYLQ